MVSLSLSLSRSLARTVHKMRTTVSQVAACNLYLSGQWVVHDDGQFIEAIPLSTWQRHEDNKNSPAV